MARRRKSDGAAAEKKRRAVKVKMVDREHSGKVVKPYAVMEKLIADHHPALAEARIVLFWQKGWRPDADGVLCLAKVKKASDVDKELSEFDFAVMLNHAAWNETRMDEEVLAMSIDDELHRCRPEMDRDGSQRSDDRGRLCWRLAGYPIKTHPEMLRRYGLKKITGLNASAIAALDDVARREEAAKDSNDETRPLLKAAEKAESKPDGRPAASWRSWKVSGLADHGLPAGKLKLLEEAGLTTMGKLVDRMRRPGSEDFWWKDIKGFGETGYDAMVDAMEKLRKARPEFQADEAA